MKTKTKVETEEKREAATKTKVEAETENENGNSGNDKEKTKMKTETRTESNAKIKNQTQKRKRQPKKKKPEGREAWQRNVFLTHPTMTRKYILFLPVFHNLRKQFYFLNLGRLGEKFKPEKTKHVNNYIFSEIGIAIRNIYQVDSNMKHEETAAATAAVDQRLSHACQTAAGACKISKRGNQQS